MSLPHILLGLTAQPTSGYDIKQCFDTRLKHFWFAELSQLYPALKKLVDQGLATVETIPSDKGPDKKVYHRTKSGREELLNWLADGPGGSPIRHSYLAQVFFLHEHTDKAEAITFMEELYARLKKTETTFKAIEDGWAKNPAYPDELDDNDFFTQLTLDAGIRVNKAYIEWCASCLKRIKARM